MIILHCIVKEKWEKLKMKDCLGTAGLQQDGLLHCSTIEFFWRVAPNFCNERKEMVLLCIDTDKLEAEVKWEDLDNCGRKYPHIYGAINIAAVQMILPYNKDESGNWIKNKEFMSYDNK